jgi:hypothetical protein
LLEQLKEEAINSNLIYAKKKQNGLEIIEEQATLSSRDNT